MIRRTNQTLLVEKIAENLQKEIKKPNWASFVKTGVFKERPPADNNWWFTRAASVLRKVYLKCPIGVSKLTTLYGGKKNRGYKPERFYPGSSNIARKILQELEKAGLVKQGVKGVRKGRIATPKAISLITKTEQEILKTEKQGSKPKEASISKEPKKADAKKEKADSKQAAGKDSKK